MICLRLINNHTTVEIINFLIAMPRQCSPATETVVLLRGFLYRPFPQTGEFHFVTATLALVTVLLNAKADFVRLTICWKVLQTKKTHVLGAYGQLNADESPCSLFTIRKLTCHFLLTAAQLARSFRPSLFVRHAALLHISSFAATILCPP